MRVILKFNLDFSKRKALDIVEIMTYVYPFMTVDQLIDKFRRSKMQIFSVVLNKYVTQNHNDLLVVQIKCLFIPSMM